MKKISIIALCGLALCLSSCLKAGLDDNLPKFKDALITDVFMEYRFAHPTKTINGSPKVIVVNLNLIGKQLKRIEDNPGAATDSAIFTVQVPGTTEDFTTEERNKVSLANLVFMSNISPAAIMSAVEGAPRPGVPGDFSQPRKYQVKAADGTVRIWTVRVQELVK